MSRAPRTLARVVPLAAAEPDGLMVTTDGAYVRLVECASVLAPQAGGRAHREQIRERLGTLAARIPAGQGLQILVEADPLDADCALEQDWRETGTAAAAVRARGELELADAMQRLGYGLEQTVRRSAPLLDAARVRWSVATRWTPTARHHEVGAAAHELARPLRRPAVRSLERGVHERAAADSLQFSDAIASELAAAGCQVGLLDGGAALAALARAIRPNSGASAGELAELTRVLDTTRADEALAHRTSLLHAVAAGTRLGVGRDWLTHTGGDVSELEAVMHLSAPPEDTSVWWLLGLMQVAPPWRLVVHVTATDRARQRRRSRLRHKRLWAELRRRERRGTLITEEAYEEEREAAELAAELRRTGAAGLYDLSLYLAIRRPAGAGDELAELTRTLTTDFESYSDARLYPGRFLAEDSWVSTLPLATDRLRATRRFAQRNIADCLPLLTTSASSRAGVPLGYAIPGQTLERVDPFDERYRTHVVLVTGASGSGKTVAINALLVRNLARGATGYIIDRSSSEDEGGSTRHQGHYEQLAALIPGARTIHFGAGQHEAILNPWDVTDPARVPASKVEFLVALHTLLIGDHAGAGEHAALGGLERTLLTRGIQAVYEHCVTTGQLPRERLLYDELRRLAREQTADTQDGDASVASELRRLAERLHPYVGDGPAAWLADRETTIPTGAPLLLCDLAGLPDALAGPVMLTLVDHIDRDVQRRRAHHLAHPGEAAGPWAGRAFVAIDEAWKPLMTPAAGAWLNEWARRTRHIACALFVITQHLADFANPQGAALLRNSVLRLFFKAAHDELAYVGDALGLHDEDLETIERLETRKGEYSTCFLDSEAHGRAQVQIYLGDIEYWTCSADPQRDQPLRHLALEQAGGDAWGALRLLVDPAWHRQRAEPLADVGEEVELAAAPPATTETGGG